MLEKIVVCFRVSIHASSREDATNVSRNKLSINGFNPRVLAGGRDLLSFFFNFFQLCFNPRVLAGGRDMAR